MTIRHARVYFITLVFLGSTLLAACSDSSTSPPDAAGPDAALPDAQPDAEYQRCGDGLVTGTEECDDSNSSDDDECLSNCMLACGDGVVNAVELCDIGIVAGQPGACPTDCDDGDACTMDVLSGDSCQSACINSEITSNINGDGCCPAGSDSTLDSDCPVVCGNAIVEPGETCDIAIAPGLGGACPEAADCVDGVACTTDVLVDGGTCTATCQNDPITLPVNDDGCCPPGATVADDNDCSASCGDGVVSPGETCDTAIAAGNPGACPTLADCADTDACTNDTLVSAGTCNAVCSNTPIIVIGPADGCCPPGGNANNDADCSPVCGNGVIETGEQCDDGNTTPGDGCDASCMTEITATAYRVSSIQLRDPHAYTTVFFFCTDITSNLNTELNNAVTMDTDGDGLLDLSVLSVFRPLNQSLATNPLEIVFSDCNAPMSGTSCAPEAGTTPIPSTASNLSTGTCLQPTPGTVRPYSPAVTNATAPCYASGTHTLDLDLGGIMLRLRDAQVGATYVGNPATSMVNGLLKGFVTEADANTTILPASLPLVGGRALSSLLPGGTGNCASHDDRDYVNGVRGWWLYFNYTANQVTWTGP
jgi:cysteine-rich repeat protein